jgi:hypothetical protein
MNPPSETPSYPKRRTDPAKRRLHGMKYRLPYVCSCGKEFRTYAMWSEHRTDESLIESDGDGKSNG